MLEDIKNDIENFKLVIPEKDKQLRDLKNILFAAIAGYKKVTEEHKNLYYPKQPARPKNIKTMFL